ncbi:MAG: alpha/beta hydrolase [Ruminococcaceae bacterium]|nr:alpha/beta hydrolase [Oscillospiraceae bacterium]
MKQWNGEPIEGTWKGFPIEAGIMMDREYIVVFPEKGTENGKWALKTEYFGAFPEMEIELLKRGYHLASIKTKTRWCLDEDTEAQAALARYLHEKLGLSAKGVPIGMSAGGIQAIYLAGKYPELVSCMYLDAAVLNFLSCPAALGKSNSYLMDEFTKERGLTLTDLLSFRDHPMDYLPALVKARIPAVLVWGDSDMGVPFDENGKLLKDAYDEAGIPVAVFLKPGGGHHPHGLTDPTPVVEFIEQYSNE